MSAACSWISGLDSSEWTQEISCEMRKARKVHKCGECGEPIQAGERYEDFFGADDGKPIRHKTCAACVEIRGHFSGSEGWIWGCIWEDMENCFPDLTAGGPCLEGLSAAAKTKLFEMWRKWKGLAA